MPILNTLTGGRTAEQKIQQQETEKKKDEENHKKNVKMNTQALMLEQEKKTQLQTTQAQLAALKRK